MYSGRCPGLGTRMTIPDVGFEKAMYPWRWRAQGTIEIDVDGWSAAPNIGEIERPDTRRSALLLLMRDEFPAGIATGFRAFGDLARENGFACNTSNFSSVLFSYSLSSEPL